MSTIPSTPATINNGVASSLSSNLSLLSSNIEENSNQLELLKKMFEGVRNTSLSSTVSNKDKSEGHVNKLQRVKDILGELEAAGGQENLITEAKEIISSIEGDIKKNISNAEESLKFAEKNFPA